MKRELMRAYGISEATARRWLSGDTDACVKRHLDRLYLREECARNGTTPSARYNRAHDGFPFDARSQCL